MPAAHASEPSSLRSGFVPYIEGTVSVELQSDNVTRSDDPAGKISDTYTTTEAGITVHFLPFFQISSTLVLEPVLDPADDRFFEDHGA